MRILNVTAQKPDSTGSGVYLAEMVRCEAAAGHETAVVCGIARDDEVTTLPAQTRLYPVRFETPELPFCVCGMSDTMPYPSTRYRDLTPEMVTRFTAAFTHALTQAAREFAPDLVICHHLYLVSSIARTCLPHVPLGVVCHSTDLRQMAQHDLERERIVAAMRQVDAVFALHGAQAREIVATYGIDPARVHVIGTGYNAQVFNREAREEDADREPVPAAAGHPAEPSHPAELIYAGKIWRKKGVASLISALDAIDPDEVPAGRSGLRLRLAGGHSGSEKEYQAIVQQAQACRWSVELLGRLPQAELADVYRSSDVFVLPSFFEGLPLVTIEALACGCKVVMTDLPGIRPWMEASLPDADVTWVEPPRMEAVDEPLAGDLPAFEARLAEALRFAIATPVRPCDTGALSWERVTAHAVEVLAGLRTQA